MHKGKIFDLDDGMIVRETRLEGLVQVAMVMTFEPYMHVNCIYMQQIH